MCNSSSSIGKKSFPNFQARATSFNLLAARTIINGLLAYGWTFPEVLSLGSELMSHVKKYLGTDWLSL
jgi:hypothetical protein